MKYSVGQQLSFKKYLVAKYGEYATITCIHEVFTGSHPGHCFKTLIDLKTENGKKVQWDLSFMRSNLQSLTSKH